VTTFDTQAEKALRRETPTRDELLEVLTSTDDDLMDLVAAASRVRRRYFERRVKLNYLVNMKSGLCPEDCFYCSQRLGSQAEIVKYTWLKPDQTREAVSHGVRAGASRVCLVASGRGRGVVVATGERLWAFHADRGTHTWGVALPGSAIVPTVGAVDYVAAVRPGAVHVLDADSGLERWRLDLSSDDEVVAVPERLLVRDTTGRTRAKDAAGGTLLWEARLPGRIVEADGDAGVAVGSTADAGAVHLVDLATGTSSWSVTLGTSSGDAASRAVLSGRTVLVATSDGALTAMDRETGVVLWTGEVRGDDPLVAADDIVVAQDARRSFVAYNTRNGRVLWRRDWLVPIPRLMVVGDRAIVTTGDYNIASFSGDGSDIDWSVRLGPFDHATTAGDTLVVADHLGMLTAVDVADGSLRWEVALPSGRSIGVAAGPDGVYASSRARAELSSFDPHTGDSEWRLRVASGPPTLSAEHVTVHYVDAERDGFGNVVATHSRILTLNRSGHVAWDVAGLGQGDEPSLLASDADTVVEVAGTTVRTYEAATGETRWEVWVAAKITAAPGVGQGVVVVGDTGGHVTTLDLETGAVVWQADLPAPVTVAPAVAPRLAVVAGLDAAVRAFDPLSGEVLWTFRARAPITDPPVATDAVVAISEHDLVGVDAATGRVLWRQTPPAPLAGPPASATGVLYVASTAGVLATLDETTGRPLGHFLVPRQIAAGPVLGGDTAFVITVFGDVYAVAARDTVDADVDAPPIGERP
jgi:outer membrane protein assembly factor BamB